MYLKTFGYHYQPNMYSIALVSIPVDADGSGKFSLFWFSPGDEINEGESLLNDDIPIDDLSAAPITGEVSWLDPASGLIVRNFVPSGAVDDERFLSCKGDFTVGDVGFWLADGPASELWEDCWGFSYFSMTSLGLLITPTMMVPPKTFPLQAKARLASILEAYCICIQFPPGLHLLWTIEPYWAKLL